MTFVLALIPAACCAGLVAFFLRPESPRDRSDRLFVARHRAQFSVPASVGVNGHLTTPTSGRTPHASGRFAGQDDSTGLAVVLTGPVRDEGRSGHSGLVNTRAT